MFGEDRGRRALESASSVRRRAFSVSSPKEGRSEEADRVQTRFAPGLDFKRREDCLGDESGLLIDERMKPAPQTSATGFILWEPESNHKKGGGVHVPG